MLSYILSPKNLEVGDKIQAGTSAEISLGNSLPVGSIPIGTIVHNVELKPGKGGQLMRAAGTFAKIIKKTDRFVVIRLHSGKFHSISPRSMATIGIVSGDKNELGTFRLRKAGQSRWRNRRPTVRGVAMNPIDHPHGGGQGKSKGGAHPVTPWGKLTKGKPTRRRKLNKFNFLKAGLPS
jgi:large subunit ribosomal protein L2